MYRLVSAFALTSVMLAACDGGDGSAGGAGNTLQAPALRISASPQVVHFFWEDPVPGRIYLMQTSVDDGLTYNDGVPGIKTDDNLHFSGGVDFPSHLYDPAKVMFRLKTCLGTTCVTSASVPLGANVAGLAEVINSEHPEREGDFGRLVAISASGDTIAIADSAADLPRTGSTHDCAAAVPTNCIPGAGVVHVYEHSLDGWHLQETISASNAGAQDHFGEMFALSGDGSTLVVGALGEDGMTVGTATVPATDDGCAGDAPAPPCVAESGAVYVFVRRSARWTQQAYLKAAHTRAGDLFGDEVAISYNGSLLAAGAMLEDGGGSDVNPDPVVDCDAAIAANCAVDSGAVYLFRLTANDMHEPAWHQESYIKAFAGNAPATGFGNFLAMSGDGRTVAVTRTNPDGASNAAYVYTNFGAGLQTDSVITPNAPDNSWFVPALDHTGNLLVLGSPWQSDSGAVIFVTHSTVGRWDQFQEVFAPYARMNIAFGHRVAVNADGTLVAAGAPFDSVGGSGFNVDFLSCMPDNLAQCAPGSGTVHLLTPVNGEWQVARSLKSPATEADLNEVTSFFDLASADLFGYSVALSGTGNRLAITAPLDDSGHAGSHGDTTDGCELLPVSNCAVDSGSVLVY